MERMRSSSSQGLYDQRRTKSAPCSPAKAMGKKPCGPVRADSFHVIHKVPVGDTLYVKAKHVQLVDKDPERAIPLFWAAINGGDRVDSALKDMAIVMKQQNRPEEAIEAIKSLRGRCSDQAQESLDNILLDLYKRCGRLDDQIALLKHKLNMIHQGLAFNGKRTKTARSQGKKFQVSVEQEATRLLGNLGWAYMQQMNYVAAEAVYRKALCIAPDNNKICNLGICLMHQGKVAEAKLLLQTVKPATTDSDSHFKSYERAQEMLKLLESKAINLDSLNQTFAVECLRPTLSQKPEIEWNYNTLQATSGFEPIADSAKIPKRSATLNDWMKDDKSVAVNEDIDNDEYGDENSDINLHFPSASSSPFKVLTAKRSFESHAETLKQKLNNLCYKREKQPNSNFSGFPPLHPKAQQSSLNIEAAPYFSKFKSRPSSFFANSSSAPMVTGIEQQAAVAVSSFPDQNVAEPQLAEKRRRNVLGSITGTKFEDSLKREPLAKRFLQFEPDSNRKTETLPLSANNSNNKVSAPGQAKTANETAEDEPFTLPEQEEFEKAMAFLWDDEKLDDDALSCFLPKKKKQDHGHFRLPVFEHLIL